MVLIRRYALILLGSCFAVAASSARLAAEGLNPSAVPTACASVLASAVCPESADLWTRLRGNFRLDRHENPAIEAEIARLARSPRALVARVEAAEPFLRYVADRVAALDLPSEIALLPFIESGYQAVAVSEKSAKGLWQLMPVTARRFGLEESWWFDPRLDLEASTRAALDYLTFLESRFEGDWLLALAAYNAGEGRVSRSMAKNRERGLPTDFWSLDLPAETRTYVPRLLALVRVVNRPSAFGLELPVIPDVPYLEKVSLAGALDLKIAAQLARMEVTALQALNPGLKRSMTSPVGEDHLFLPADKSRYLRVALYRISKDRDPRYRRVVYTVRSGDSLWAIAKHFGVPVRSLAGWNDLVPDGIIRPGRELDIWT